MKQLTINSINGYLKNNKLDQVFVVYGEERFFFDGIQAQIEEKIFKDKGEKDLNYHQFYGTENTVSEILSACLSYPMLANHKLVTVREFDKLKVDDKESFLKYISHPQPTTVLLLFAEKWDNTSFSKKILATAVSVKCRHLSSAEIYDWVNAAFEQAGISADRDSITFLIENIGNNILRLKIEIDKIINYLDPGEKLVLERVSQLTGFTREVNIFSLQKALGSKKLKNSVAIGVKLLEQGESLAAIIPMIFIFFRRLWVVKHLMAQRLTQAKILEKLGGSRFAYTDIFASTENFNSREVVEIFLKLEEADMQLKTSQKPEISILTMLCYYICKA